MNLDDFTTALAGATGLPATRERADATTRCLLVGAPTFVRATHGGRVVEVPVTLIGEGVGGRGELDWLLTHLPAVLDALGTAQATPEPFGDGPTIPAYRITAVLTLD